MAIKEPSNAGQVESQEDYTRGASEQSVSGVSDPAAGAGSLQPSEGQGELFPVLDLGAACRNSCYNTRAAAGGVSPA